MRHNPVPLGELSHSEFLAFQEAREDIKACKGRAVSSIPSIFPASTLSAKRKSEAVLAGRSMGPPYLTTSHFAFDVGAATFSA